MELEGEGRGVVGVKEGQGGQVEGQQQLLSSRIRG